jgi:hypothetical protein
MPNKFFPARSLSLNKVLGFLVLQLHFFAHLFESFTELFLVCMERNPVTDVVHFQGGSILD